jgi:hypothetical protein
MLDLKAIAVLGALLIGSLGGNLWLGHKLLNAGTECENKALQAQLDAHIVALDGRVAALDQQIQLSAADRAELIAALNDVNATEAATLNRLRRLIGDLPTPTCDPGAERVEAWNSIGRGEP